MDINFKKGGFGSRPPKEPVIEREPTREEALAYSPDKATTRKQTVALMSGLCIMLCSGILYMWSAFQPYIVSEMGWASSQVALTSAFMISFFVVGNILGGALMSRMSVRQICFSGSVLFCLGLFLTSMLGNGYPWAIYITYSLISGVGCGLIYCTVLNVLQQWYPDKSGLISGLTVSFFGLSTVILSPVAEKLLKGFGVSATFRILAVVFFAILMLASAFMERPSKLFYASKTVNNQKQSSAKQFTPKELLKEPSYYFLAFCLFSSGAAYLVLVPFIKTIAGGRGISMDDALLAIMLTGVGNAIGRVVFPALGDKLGRTVPVIFSAIVGCGACILMIFANTGSVYIAAVFLIAMAYGGGSGCFPVLTRSLFGAKHSGTNYGLVLIFLAISSVTFSGITSSISNGANPDFTPVFILCSVVALGPIPGAILIKRRAKKLGIEL